MTARALILRIELHEPRYHGQPDWPPSPARAFQALVAAAGPELERDATARALGWLERAPAPIVAAPRARLGRSLRLYVPNNDLDGKGGDPARIPDLRTAKDERPRILEPGVPLLYVWPLDDSGVPHLGALREVAERLYQLGRGRDMAFATLEAVSDDEASARLANHQGTVHRPAEGARAGSMLACPTGGTLESLQVRHEAFAHRFRVEGRGRSRSEIFVQPPRPRSRQVAYDAAPEQALFELRWFSRPTAFAPVELARVHDFVVAARDAAVSRLTAALPGQPVDAVLVGRRPGETERVPTAQRVRLVPLPSIGHDKTDPGIRRLLVEIPQAGPLRADDVRWGFANLEVEGRVLVDAAELGMRDRYTAEARTWRSITPLALPEGRRRIEPTRVADEAKDGAERSREEAVATRAVANALRHAGVDARPLSVRVQREPLHARGRRAEAFAAPPRFAKERLWHVAVTLDRPVGGPLVLGDGRFLGLGLLVPDRTELPLAYGWQIVDGLAEGSDPIRLAQALRRAVIARAQQEWGDGRPLPRWVSGHEPSGAPAKDDHAHLTFVADLDRSRLLVLLPAGQRADGRLSRALGGLAVLRAGAAGILTLAPIEVTPDDPLLASASRWQSITPYRVNRHRKQSTAAEAVAIDVRAACRAQGLPSPIDVLVRQPRAQRGAGLEADVELVFATAVPGPMLLGRTRHVGGGVFVPPTERDVA